MAHILILEDDLELGARLCDALERAGHRAVVFAEYDGALQHLEEEEVDLLISDMFIRVNGRMAEQGGISLISKVKGWSMSGGRRIPIIAMSGAVGVGVEIGTLNIATQMGADHVIAKPFLLEEMVDLAADVLAGNPRPMVTLARTKKEPAPQPPARNPNRPAHVLVVEDDLELATSIEETLQDAGHTTFSAQHIEGALALLEAKVFDLVISDVFLPRDRDDERLSPSGASLIIRKVKMIEAMGSRIIPVVVISGGMFGISLKDEVLGAAIDIGAAAGLMKPFSDTDLLDVVQRELGIWADRASV